MGMEKGTIIRIILQVSLILALLIIAFTILGLFLREISDQKNNNTENPGELVYSFDGTSPPAGYKWQGTGGGSMVYMESSVTLVDSSIASSQVSLLTTLYFQDNTFVTLTSEGSGTQVIRPNASLVVLVGKTYYTPPAKALVPTYSTTVYLTGSNLDDSESSFSDPSDVHLNDPAKDPPYYEHVPSVNLFGRGSVYMYPFDEYTTEMYFSVFNPDLFKNTSAAYRNSTDKANFTLPNTFPTLFLNLFLTPNSKYGWETKIDVIPFEDLPFDTSLDYMARSATGIRVKVKRTDIFRLYPVFMIIAFWTITFSIVNYGSHVFIWDTRDITGFNTPLIGFVVGLLFVLPSYRNTAPGIPPAGCVIDFAGLYWAILAAIMCGLGVLVKYSII